MKTLGGILVQKGPFEEIVIGNTAIVRAMMEGGVKVVTSYPGSPTPEIAEAINSIPKEVRPFYFEFSVNEKVALEVAFGAALNGNTSCVFFKSVGMNVVADSFVQLSMMRIPGGMIIVVGDDPGANSSQNEQDNRHYMRMSYTPVFEPCNAQEIYDMFLEALRISRTFESAIVIRLTTHTAHFKQKVRFGEYIPNSTSMSIFDPKKRGPYIPLGEAVFMMKRRALENLQKYSEISENHVKLIAKGNQRGIITAGLPFATILDVLGERVDYVDILKLGMIHPLPRKAVVQFLKSHKEVKIVEELDDFLEEKIKAIAYDEGLETKIIGKLSIDEWIGEYLPDKVEEVLFDTWPDLVEKPEVPKMSIKTVKRVPQLCPGCGHRAAFYVISKVLSERDISVADIGCHTLGYLPPYEVGQVLLCMGHSNGTASGLSLFNSERKVIALIGDSTFFHAGLPGIINAVYNDHKYVLIVMENYTTAMTGHQDHAGSKIKIKSVLEAFGIKNIYEVDTYNYERFEQVLREAIAAQGFSVIIARHPCMLKFTRERRVKGFAKVRQVRVTEKCNLAMSCISIFGCPSFQRIEGNRVLVQKELCIGDGSCLAVCPKGALAYEEGDQR